VSDTKHMFAVIDATWPPARFVSRGPFTLRRGKGGGNRVSAATLDGPPWKADMDFVEREMRGFGQEPLFMIRPGDDAIDEILAARGYATRDTVTIYACPIEHLCDMPLPRVTVFTIWKPLAIMREIWAQGGIGPKRLAVMDRVKGHKTGMLARQNEKPGGAAFVALHEGTAMLHGLEILPHQRQQGLGGWMMRGAAIWARDLGAHTMSVMCTKDNNGANALYASLGMGVVGHYHYRFLPSETKHP